ncbi:MAG TPA: adenine phosphoribosyltransferase [bacterium]|nr:adenine phosphoribosyltransferase [bacterium]HNH34251.1 adenine phosphoribosyltransferase [bacterium]
MDYKKYIREVPDFPKPGINFKDISTLVGNADAFRHVIRTMTEDAAELKVDLVAGIESRGFIFGAAIAEKMGIGFIPVRKPGKLPYQTISASYALEYGENTLHMHTDAIQPEQRVLIVDDLLATGGTVGATCALVEKLGGKVAAISVVIELSFLGAREKLNSYKVMSLVDYSGE